MNCYELRRVSAVDFQTAQHIAAEGFRGFHVWLEVCLFRAVGSEPIFQHWAEPFLCMLDPPDFSFCFGKDFFLFPSGGYPAQVQNDVQGIFFCLFLRVENVQADAVPVGLFWNVCE